ncbi:MAG: putative inorganic carbon transporter subunit DabA, partial [Pseudomonadota bacterium]
MEIDMFLKHSDIAPARATDILRAADAAARAIPPAFPLDATVAVNPFLGQTGEGLATASARLTRVAGARATQGAVEYAAEIRAGRITDADIVEALAAARSDWDVAGVKAALKSAEAATPRALPTVADLAAAQSGTDWPSLIEKSIGLWAAGQFDRGQALWSPTPGLGSYAAWRAWAAHDLTPEIAGLTGFCAHVAGAPDSAARAILRASDALALTDAAAETAFHRLYMDLGGWAQHARWLLWQAELAGGLDETMADLLAIRLVWDEALLAHVPGIADAWADTVAAHATPVCPDDADVALAILQDAADRAHQRRLITALDGPTETRARPFL